jgi:hypothetical protein
MALTVPAFADKPADNYGAAVSVQDGATRSAAVHAGQEVTSYGGYDIKNVGQLIKAYKHINYGGPEPKQP